MHFPRLNQWLAAFGMLMIFTGFSGVVNDLLYPDESLDYQFDRLEQSTSQGFVPYFLPAETQSATEAAPDGTVSPTPDEAAVASGDPASGTTQGLPIPTPAPTHVPGVVYLPDRLVIPAINLDAPVKPSLLKVVKIGESFFEQWNAPDELAAGWNSDSASLGVPGNTVLIGHHNIHGKVFAHLSNLKAGDFVMLYSGPQVFVYVVSNVMILPEKYQELEIRLQNARWLEHTDDERVTLVSCWPPDNNTNRVVVVARPFR
ncbi:MAG TPA: sortase [Anaerolineaceae bacterium]|nr:sortase [Anaerolineaceae bacterium]